MDWKKNKYHPNWNDIDANTWNLCNDFSVPEAAALIANVDPFAIGYNQYQQKIFSADYTDDKRHERANIIFTEMIKAIANGELEAEIPAPPDPTCLDDVPF